MIKNDIEIVISILLAFIAWQNYKIGKAGFYIQKDKLRLDLFEKRYKVFEAFQTLFGSFITSAVLTRQDLAKFWRGTSDVEFLFGKELKDYRNEIDKKALRLIHMDERLKNSTLTDEARNKLIEEMSKIETWFMDQLQNSGTLFRKYLHFSIDKNP